MKLPLSCLVIPYSKSEALCKDELTSDLYDIGLRLINCKLKFGNASLSSPTGSNLY